MNKNSADIIAHYSAPYINLINQGKSPSFPPPENIILIYDDNVCWGNEQGYIFFCESEKRVES